MSDPSVGGIGTNTSATAVLNGTAGNNALGSPGLPNENRSDKSDPYYKVFINAELPSGKIVNIVADGPESFEFSTSLQYDTPYQDIAEKAIDGALSNIPVLGKVASSVIKGSGTKLFTQALTAKVWSGAGETTISLPLIFHVESDEESDVLTPLMQLMMLSMPRESTAGGFLSAPGPQFDFGILGSSKNGAAYSQQNVRKSNQAVFSNLAGSVTNSVTNTLTNTGKAIGNLDALGAISSVVNGSNDLISSISNSVKDLVKYPISLQIGQGFFLKNVVIDNVSQTHRLSPVGGSRAYSSSGINSSVLVNVSFKTFYTLTQRDISSILMPMNIKNSVTMSKYKEYLNG